MRFLRLPLPLRLSADADDDDDDAADAAADGAMTARKHFNAKRQSHMAAGGGPAVVAGA